MGLFGRTPKPAGGRDWSQGPIEPSEFAKFAEPYVDSLDIVEHGIALSGVEPTEVDKIEALVRVWNVQQAILKDLLSAEPRIVAGLDVVAARPDFNDELMWNYLTHVGPVGVAARNHLTETYSRTGRLAEIVATVIREGGMRVDLGGRDRI
ncbi:MAG: hypothetical protein ACI379_11850 [Nocardioides sp.]|uniref:hypothetical protein n=1 Tax=Nocardioides sp. TaxID=35761 RepID=UPI003F0EF6D1